MKPLLDTEGENLAVRSFLRAYGGNVSITVGWMKEHMLLCGWDGLWPKWVSLGPPTAHLTKAGAQLWIRHLLSLEVTMETGIVDAAVTIIDSTGQRFKVFGDTVTPETPKGDLQAEVLSLHKQLAAANLKAERGWARYESANRMRNDLLEDVASLSASPKLTVRLTSFPESNGKRNWTAMFSRATPWNGLLGSCGGITIDRGEYWNRVAYEAERAKFLLGERETEPHILDYGDDITTPEEWKGEIRGARVKKS